MAAVSGFGDMVSINDIYKSKKMQSQGSRYNGLGRASCRGNSKAIQAKKAAEGLCLRYVRQVACKARVI